MDYPSEVRRLNRLLESELGANPRYGWRWSEDLLHVMYVVDEIGRPVYEERMVTVPTDEVMGVDWDLVPIQETVNWDKVIYSQIQKTQVRKLLPNHQDQWVACAMIEVDDKDGSLLGTGCGSWVPISSSASGPAALPQGMLPTQELTQSIIRAIRQERDMPKDYLITGFEESSRKRERDRWNTAYDRIRDASTAYYNVPGKRGHVSFPTVNKGSNNVNPSA